MFERLAGGIQGLSKLIFPPGLCFFSALLLHYFLPAQVATATWVPFLPPLLLAVVSWIAWRLHRIRVLLSAVLIGVIWMVGGNMAAGRLGLGNREVVIYALELFFPLNLALISLLRDRGFVHRTGLGMLLIFGAQGLVVGFELKGPGLGAQITEVIAELVRLVHWPGLGRCLPELALGASALVILLRFLWRRSAIEAGLFWTLAATALAVRALGSSPVVADFYLCAASVILLVSTVEHGYFLAYRDALTGLLSRRALDERLNSLGGRYAIAMVDIDRFKRFNDRHGHDAGDQLLRMVASRLMATRGGAVAYRYGGEEFALVFAGCKAQDVQGYCEALRKSIVGKRFTLRHWRRPRCKPKRVTSRNSLRKQVSVSVSIGLAERGDAARSAREVIKRADRALYRAKRRGRNRVVLLEGD